MEFKHETYDYTKVINCKTSTNSLELVVKEEYLLSGKDENKEIKIVIDSDEEINRLEQFLKSVLLQIETKKKKRIAEIRATIATLQEELKRLET